MKNNGLILYIRFMTHAHYGVLNFIVYLDSFYICWIKELMKEERRNKKGRGRKREGREM